MACKTLDFFPLRFEVGALFATSHSCGTEAILGVEPIVTEQQFSK